MDYLIYKKNDDADEFNCITSKSTMISVRNGSDGVYAIGIVSNEMGVEVVLNYEDCSKKEFNKAYQTVFDKVHKSWTKVK